MLLQCCTTVRVIVAIHHPDRFDPAIEEDAALHHDIDVLNDEMVDAGIRVFVGGFQPVTTAWSIRKVDGQFEINNRPYLSTDEHVGGFWVLDVANIEEAIEWGRKATVACRRPVEVRPFN